MPAPKPRAIIDTNLFVSGLILVDSLPSHLLKVWQKDLFTLLISDEILKETEEVLQRKRIRNRYHILPEKITALINDLKLAAEFVNPFSEEVLPVHCRDAKDDKLLAAALGGQADFLITGDKDLLVLNGLPKLGKLKILNARKFLSLLSFLYNKKA